jgi:hypothetical protein
MARGFKVVGGPKEDFLDGPGARKNGFDCIITNPPYSRKDEYLEKCYKLGRPFALLLPLTALEGRKRQALYKKYGVQLIVPSRRINFITPGGGRSAWFMTAWFTHGLHLPREINFVELNREASDQLKVEQTRASVRAATMRALA